LDDEALRQVVEMLEIHSGSGEGKSRLAVIGPPWHLFLTANRQALIKLACTLLRAAEAPILDKDSRSETVEIDSQIDQVDGDSSDRCLKFVQRMETWPEPPEAIAKRERRARWLDGAGLLGCGIVAFVVLAVFMAGLIAIWKVTLGS
jgi:hypothetical protein